MILSRDQNFRTAVSHMKILLCIFYTVLSVPTSEFYELPGNEALKNSADDNVCRTAGCLNAASVIRDYMDETYDPCDNFYAFSCGGFFSKTKKPEETGIVSLFTKIEDRIYTELKTLLEENDKQDEPRIFHLVKMFYKSCINLKKLDLQAADPLRSIIDHLGGWPVVEGKYWSERDFDWVDMDIKLRSMGFKPKNIFHIFVFNDLYNSANNVLYVNPMATHIGAATLMKGRSNDKVGNYRQFIEDTAIYFGASEKRANEQSDQIVDFEIKLAKIANLGRPGGRKKISIDDLQGRLPTVDWDKYINGLTHPILHVNRTDAIIKVKNPSYFLNVKRLLENTSNKTIANYMIWRTIADSAPYIGGTMGKIYRNFRRNLVGEEFSDRRKQCVGMLNDKSTGLTVGLSSMYVRRFFNDESRRAIKPVLEAILKQFQETIMKSTWMDNSTKEAAVRKSTFMKKVIAYPTELLNDGTIDNYTRRLAFNESCFLRNVLNLNRFHYDFALGGLSEQVAQRLWITLSDSTQTQAYYDLLSNTFAILAGILQSPIFNLNWPNYAKFGSIGFIIGHEMMHAFDSKNILFDETGSYRTWVTPEVKEEYDRKLDCFIAQYEKYIDRTVGISVDGELTLNENLADNVGLKVSFNAYNDWSRWHVDELPLPGLNYTNEQIFWMTSIHFLCNRNTNNYRLQVLMTDTHTLNGFRATGSVTNSYDFARAFNCPVSSPMNPKRKCQLW